MGHPLYTCVIVQPDLLSNGWHQLVGLSHEFGLQSGHTLFLTAHSCDGPSQSVVWSSEGLRHTWYPLVLSLSSCGLSARQLPGEAGWDGYHAHNIRGCNSRIIKGRVNSG